MEVEAIVRTYTIADFPLTHCRRILLVVGLLSFEQKGWDIESMITDDLMPTHAKLT